MMRGHASWPVTWRGAPIMKPVLLMALMLNVFFRMVSGWIEFCFSLTNVLKSNLFHKKYFNQWKNTKILKLFWNFYCQIIIPAPVVTTDKTIRNSSLDKNVHIILTKNHYILKQSKINLLYKYTFKNISVHKIKYKSQIITK